jgi:ubiquinone/menaquinone biosynthesis C-methylase UbiE
MSDDFIKQYWEEQGKLHGDSHWASWGDNWMIDLEIETIGKYINDGDCVLDVGCSNGYAAFRQAETHKLKSITGVDFASNMVLTANETRQQKGLNVEIEFMEGDVRSLDFSNNSFDVVYTTRVLINLPTWTHQKKGIQECIRVAKPNGIIVLSEGFWEPLVLLNALRTLKGLEPLVEHDFNRYLKLSALKTYLDELGQTYQINDFSSIYYLGSRFLRELVTEVSAYPGFSNPINKLFFEIEKQFSGGGFGIQQAVIIEKHA